MTSTRLAPCPSSPNCVSSDAPEAAHAVAALALAVPAADAWHAVRAAVGRLPRATIVEDGPGYLRAECRSRLFRFVDDLELELRAADGIVAVRSAARIGRHDLGVNRRRVERLRAALRAEGIVR
ncbi:MAG TPA: DUF1499 domain-containing protein [Vicinamibacterales bacterium]|nr:DUF1499 domain-containing protein [Vicinamibacterales bacterium]